MIEALAQIAPQDEWRAYFLAAVLNGGVALSLSTYVFRVRRINRARAARGQAALSWGQVTDMRATTHALIADESGDVAKAAAELARQIAWEQQQAMTELARYGRAQTRAFCATHDRWCLRGWEGPHPAGGHDHPRAPADWTPGHSPLGPGSTS